MRNDAIRLIGSIACVAALEGCGGGGGGEGCEGGCVIDEVCVPNGFANPADPCGVCDAAASTTAWSDNDGAACDDGDFCTVGDACGAGSCGGTARDCSDGVACNGDETCDESGDACTPGAATCGADQVCDVSADECVATCTGCVVGGLCYGDGQVHPSDPCSICDVSDSATSWSDNDGAACDDGEFCTDGDTCAGGTCAGTVRDCSDGVACNGAETCDESGDECIPGTATCGTNEICDVPADECVATCTGCVVGDLCYGDGQVDPADPCRICDATASATSWSDNDGAECDDLVFCNGADTCAGGACDAHAGSPCGPAETCAEDRWECCAQDAYLACNAAGDAEWRDSCGFAGAVADDCAPASAGGACADGICGCDEGRAGEDCSTCVVFVDGDAGSDSYIGTTWALAKATVQAGIDTAVGSGCQVWVKEGTYVERIALEDGVALFGGFSGDEISPEHRDLAANETILDGDGGGTVVVCDGTLGCTDEAIIDGFTITGGAGTRGGGMYNRGASPTVRQCRFVLNHAANGGGMYNDTSFPMVASCTFEGNYTDDGADGASMHLSWDHLAWAENGSPAGHGGGMYNASSSPVLEDCIFSGNHTGSGGSGGDASTNDDFFVDVHGGNGAAAGSGGAVYNNVSVLIAKRTVFTDNHTGDGGDGGEAMGSVRDMDVRTYGGAGGGSGAGGAISSAGSTLVAVGCVFSGNRTGNGGAGGLALASAGMDMIESHGGSGGAAGAGGAIAGASSTVTGSVIEGNGTGSGGSGGDANSMGMGMVWAFAGAGGPGGAGGGVHDAASVAIAVCTIAGNGTGDGGAGGDATSPEIAEDGLAGAAGIGGGVLSTNATVSNSILWGNSTASAADTPAEEQIRDATATVTYCDVEGGAAYVGDIDSDPLFVSTALGDLRLSEGSPCIDTGNGALLPVDEADLDGDLDVIEPLPLDLDGRDRMLGGLLDMGAYQR